MYDVVIIGAGLAGLSAGLRLSNEGKRVAILEKHMMPGGYATNFKRKDKDKNVYVFDTALHGIGGLRANNSLNMILDQKLGILKNIKLLEKPEAATVLKFNGEEIDIPSEFGAYKAMLIQNYPSERENIERLFAFLMEVKEDMLQVTQVSDRMPKHNAYLESITLYDFLKTYTDNEGLIETFSFLWLYYGLPPKELNALYYILPWISYHIGGTYYIEGGAGKLSDTFKEMIEAKGSKVFLSSEVVKIDTYKDEIIGVTTKKGDVFKGEKYIIACDPNPIFDMIEGDQEVKAYKDKLDTLEKGISLTQLYIGLNCKSQDIGIEKGDYFIEVSDHEATYRAIQNGDYEEMGFGITSYDILDPNLNGENRGVIAIVIGDKIENWETYKSEAYKNQKKIVADQLIAKAEKVFPKLREHIEVMELGTPHTMKRYTNNSDGAVYGWAQSVGQGGFSRVSFKTPLKNTLLAGSWSNPGGGFEGAITSGVMCADRMLRTTKEPSDTGVKKEPEMNINVFMAGMAANVSPKKSKGIDLVYHFNFDQKHDFYMHIKKGKGILLKERPSKVDLTIHTSYSVWYDIAFNGRSGADALFDGDIKVEGPTELFMKLPDLLGTDSLSKEEKATEHRKINALVWVNLALVPWIIYWIGGAYLEDVLLSAIATVYLVAFISFIKPKAYRTITLLEGATFIVFAVNSFVASSYFVDISLILICLVSLIMGKPMTAAYSKMEYTKEIVRTHLFHNINMTLTTIWTIVFVLRWITATLLDTPLNNISYIFVIIGLVISYVYPKKKLNF